MLFTATNLTEEFNITSVKNASREKNLSLGALLEQLVTLDIDAKVWETIAEKFLQTLQDSLRSADAVLGLAAATLVFTAVGAVLGATAYNNSLRGRGDKRSSINTQAGIRGTMQVRYASGNLITVFHLAKASDHGFFCLFMRELVVGNVRKILLGLINGYFLGPHRSQKFTDRFIFLNHFSKPLFQKQQPQWQFMQSYVTQPLRWNIATRPTRS